MDYLANCTPAIFKHPSQSEVPPGVANLCHLFSSATGNPCGVVPRALQQEVENHPNSRLHPFPSHVWSTDLDPTHNYDRQWDHVVSLFEEAAHLDEANADGRSWYPLIKRALDGGSLDERTKLR